MQELPNNTFFKIIDNLVKYKTCKIVFPSETNINIVYEFKASNQLSVILTIYKEEFDRVYFDGKKVDNNAKSKRKRMEYQDNLSYKNVMATFLIQALFFNKEEVYVVNESKLDSKFKLPTLFEKCIRRYLSLVNNNQDILDFYNSYIDGKGVEYLINYQGDNNNINNGDNLKKYIIDFKLLKKKLEFIEELLYIINYSENVDKVKDAREELEYFLNLKIKKK